MRIGIASAAPAQAAALRQALQASGEHRLAWVARSGIDAVRLCADLPPELVLMDLDLPLLDGVEATRRIMAQAPCAILVLTARPQDKVGQVFRALGAGALDVVAMPPLADGAHAVAGAAGVAALLARIRTVARLVAPRRPAAPAPVPGLAPGLAPRLAPDSGPPVAQLVAIGASSGGPAALARLFGHWRPAADTAVLVVQHIDASFSAQLAKWLGEQTAAGVSTIADGDPLAGGMVQLAAGADHLRLAPGRRLRYDARPDAAIHRPSIDVLFHSLARHWDGPATAVLLTGMGRDGAAGLLAMRKAGHQTIAQDQASSAVYGMPRAAAELGAARQILPIEQIGAALSDRIGP